MRAHTMVRVGGVLTAAGLLLSPTLAWADHEDGWSPQPQASEQPQDYQQQPEPDASSEPTSPAQDGESAGSRSGTSKQMAPAQRTSTSTASDTSAAQAAAATCPTDDGLPVPVAGTVLDTVGTVQDTVEGVVGPLPVDVTGTVGGALGCSAEPSASPEPAPSDEPVVTPSDEPTAGESSAVAVIGASLPEAASAEAVSARVSFAG
ncbi:MAG: hypothetical protein Q8R60_04645 [Mycobacteriales bacterium]|nr:hypothetical protein [Mycobacteriales bacterium]